MEKNSACGPIFSRPPTPSFPSRTTAVVCVLKKNETQALMRPAGPIAPWTFYILTDPPRAWWVGAWPSSPRCPSVTGPYSFHNLSGFRRTIARMDQSGLQGLLRRNRQATQRGSPFRNLPPQKIIAPVNDERPQCPRIGPIHGNG